MGVAGTRTVLSRNFSYFLTIRGIPIDTPLYILYDINRRFIMFYVYRITLPRISRSYIGMTANPAQRFQSHLAAMVAGRHTNDTVRAYC